MPNFFDLPQFKCLENLVGISRKDCECLPAVPDAKTIAIRRSDSGLFIDEHDGAVGCLFLSKATCSEGDVWDRLLWARREAILQMILDISVSLNNRYQAVNDYYHQIGEPQFATLLQLVSGKKSISLKTKNLEGSKIRFSQVGLLGKLLNNVTQETITITFTNVTTNTVVKQFYFDVKNVSTGYGVLYADKQLHDLPPFDLECDGSEYEISYILNADNLLVYDNKVTCSCGGVESKLRSYYSVLPSGSAFGLMFQVAYVCDDNYLLCALTNSNQTLKYLICEGIRCLTLYKFINNAKATASHGATLSNILSISNNDGLLESFSGKYNQTIEDLREKTLFLPNFGCFGCNVYNHTQKGMISVSDPFYDVPFVSPDFYNYPLQSVFNSYEETNGYIPPSRPPMLQ